MTLSIEELCEKYSNEDVHTQHVTALALKLFDNTRQWLGVPESERPLLEAAGRLHDVAYSVARERHAEAGPRIVLREGLAGFTTAQRADIAKIMALHSGKWRAAISPRLLRLGAFLRAADGLDYSHAQDAVIVGVRRKQRTIHISIRCDAFPHNVERADAKADLWRSVFPLDVRFTLAGANTRPAPLIRPRDDVREAARRLMWIQFKTILVHADGAVGGTDPEHLHDIRVALRRLRLLFRIFRKELPQKSARQLDRALAQLGRTLAPARDADVWVEFLQRPGVARRMADADDWSAFLGRQAKIRERELLRVRRAFRSTRFRSLRSRMSYFLRTELPRLIEAGKSSGSTRDFAAKRLQKELQRSARLARWRHSKSADKLHELRIALRRARYVAEFFAPVLGRKATGLADRLREIERPLGQIHDVDVALERIAHQRPAPPRALLKLLQRRRRKNLKQLARAWQSHAPVDGD